MMPKSWARPARRFDDRKREKQSQRAVEKASQ